MKKSPSTSITRPRIRVGEGTAVAVARRVTPRPDGTSTVELQVNVQDAPVPERRYVADTGGVIVNGESVQFVFAQRRLSTGLRSMVLVRLTADAARLFLASCEDFAPRVRDYLARIGSNDGRAETFVEEPAQTVALVANSIAATHFGREASFDFYQISPEAMRRLISNSDTLPIEGVVRVDVTTSLMMSIIDALFAQAAVLAAEAL